MSHEVFGTCKVVNTKEKEVKTCPDRNKEQGQDHPKNPNPKTTQDPEFPPLHNIPLHTQG